MRDAESIDEWIRALLGGHDRVPVAVTGGAVVALLVAVILVRTAGLRGDIGELRGAVGELRERVARIEGLLERGDMRRGRDWRHADDGAAWGRVARAAARRRGADE